MIDKPSYHDYYGQSVCIKVSLKYIDIFFLVFMNFYTQREGTLVERGEITDRRSLVALLRRLSCLVGCA
jgi:hypothetical protein